MENLQTYESIAIYWYLLVRSMHSNTNWFSMFHHASYVLLFCCFNYADSCFDYTSYIFYYLCFIILIYICIYTHLFDFHNYPSYCKYSPFFSTSLPPAEETAIWCIEYRTYRNEGFLIESFSEAWTCCVGWLCVDDVVKMCRCEKRWLWQLNSSNFFVARLKDKSVFLWTVYVWLLDIRWYQCIMSKIII